MSPPATLPTFSARAQCALPPSLLHLEGDDLALHLAQCRQTSRVRLVALMWAERAHGWIAPRFVTSIAISASALTLLLAWR